MKVYLKVLEMFDLHFSSFVYDTSPITKPPIPTENSKTK